MAPRAKRSQPAPAPPAPPADPDWTYETAVSQVEAIIGQLETGELSLEDVFSQFGQAVASLQQCEAYLAAKQAQVDVLIETLGS